jgi:hypothetical protein
LLMAFQAMGQSAAKSKMLKPEGFTKRVTTVIGGKSRYYYSLDNNETSLITVQGPGKLRVITRARFSDEKSGKLNYDIQYTINGGETQIVNFKSISRSINATYLKGTLGKPGQPADFVIELGRGANSIEFIVSNNSSPVAARYLFTPTKGKKISWVPYSPAPPAQPVELITGENITKYYRFSDEKPLMVEVNGPTQLRVFTRIENHYQMKGRIHYRIQVLENGEVVNTYQLSSVRSEVTVYRENNDLIPGKGCEFIIEAPAGRHVYKIVPLDEDKNTVLGRLFIPKKDIKIETKM